MSATIGPQAPGAATATPAASSASEATAVPVYTDPNARVAGVCKFWNNRGYGFIVPADGGDDVFCHFKEIKDGNCLTEGAKVEFRRVWDATKQKHRAEALTGGITDQKYVTAPSGKGVPGTGTVKLWNADKGFGFVLSDDTRMTDDIFVHFRGIVDGDSLEKGEKVVFNMIRDEVKGNYKGEQVRRIPGQFAVPEQGRMYGGAAQYNAYGQMAGYNPQAANYAGNFAAGMNKYGGYGGGYAEMQAAAAAGGTPAGGAGFAGTMSNQAAAVRAAYGAQGGFNAAPGSHAIAAQNLQAAAGQAANGYGTGLIGSGYGAVTSTANAGGYGGANAAAQAAMGASGYHPGSVW